MNTFAMSAAAPQMDRTWAISPEERVSSEKQFYTIGPVKGKITGDQARTFFLKTGLGRDVLGAIWGLSDLDSDGQMTLEEFTIAMKLISMRLKGTPVPTALPDVLRPGAMGMMGLSNNMGTGLVGGGSIQPITHQERLRYKQQFNAHDRAKVGFLTGVQSRHIFVMESRLPQNILAHIWTLSDVDKDGNLNQEEFVLAQHLVQAAKNGIPLPPTLPPFLHPKASQAGWRPASPDTEDARIANFRAGQELLDAKRRALLEEEARAREESMRRLAAEEARKQSMQDKAAAEAERKRQMELAEIRRRAEIELANQRRVQEHMEAQRLAQEEEMRRQTAAMQELIQSREKLRQNVNNLTLRLAQLNGQLTGLEPRKTQLEAMVLKGSREREEVLGAVTLLEGQTAQRQLEMSRMEGDYKNMEQLLQSAQMERNNLSQKLIQVFHMKAGKTQGTQQVKQVAENLGKEQIDTITKLQTAVETTSREVTQARVQLQEYQSSLQALTLELDNKRQRKAAAASDVEAVKERRAAVAKSVEEQQQQLEAETRRREQEERARAEAVARQQQQQMEAEKRRREEERARAEAARLQGAAAAATIVPATVAAAAAAAAAATITYQAPPSTSSFVSAGPPSLGAPEEYIALYDYVGDKEDDLTFMAGDTITVSSKNDDGWWHGTCLGRQGWFPMNYVEPAPVAAPPSVPELPPEPETYPPAPEEDLPPPPPPAAAESKPGNVHAALYTYESSNAGDLAFNGGDRITIISTGDDGWWEGECNGRQGWFPANYVDPNPLSLAELEQSVETPEMPPPPPETQPISAPSMMSLHGTSAKTEQTADWVTALHSYTAQLEDELTFSEGDVFSVIQKDGDWWQGTHNGHTGWFPANYVEVNSADQAAPEAPPVEAGSGGISNPFSMEALPTADTDVHRATSTSSQKPVIAKVVEAYTATDSNQLTLKKGALVNVTNMEEGDWWEGTISIKGKGKEAGWFPKSCVSLIGKAAKDTGSSAPTSSDQFATAGSGDVDLWATVAYDFTPSKDDELGLTEGQRVRITKQEEGGWWYGEVDGRAGWFPENYVQLDGGARRGSVDSFN